MRCMSFRWEMPPSCLGCTEARVFNGAAHQLEASSWWSQRLGACWSWLMTVCVPLPMSWPPPLHPE